MVCLLDDLGALTMSVIGQNSGHSKHQIKPSGPYAFSIIHEFQGPSVLSLLAPGPQCKTHSKWSVRIKHKMRFFPLMHMYLWVGLRILHNITLKYVRLIADLF